MRYNIPTIADEDLALAGSAEVGAETNVYASYEELFQVAELVQGALLADAVLTQLPFVAPGAGVDMQVRCLNGVQSAVGIVLTFGVTFADATNGTATATFLPPDYARDQSFNMPIGLAVDLLGVGAGAAKKIVTINSVTVITGGQAGNRFQIISGPERVDYFFVICATNKSPTLPSQKSINIACGYDAARWIKKGRSEVPALEITAKYVSARDGLMSLNGHRVTCMIETTKDDFLLTERQVFGGWRPGVKPTHPDGDDNAEAVASGNFESFAVFV